MPSLVLTGHPCTGKTTFARLLAARALRHPSNVVSRVVHISERTARPDVTKAACYSDSAAEKTTRAALKAEFDRAVMSTSDGGTGGGSTLVILDSLNYIKGYRYELYCISKAAGERHGVVWIVGDGSDGEGARAGASDELAKRRNRERRELQTKRGSEGGSVENDIDFDGYFEDDEIMDELVLRYEPPDEKNRWENPLYRVNVASVLPWGKDGTIAEVSSGRNAVSSSASDKKEEEPGKLLSSQMKSMDVKESFNQKSTTSVPLKPPKKSASGFKRRGKKSAQQGSPRPTQPTTTSDAPTTRNNVPSSMASRNLTPGASGDHGIGSERKMEDVIDNILECFLVKNAPLKEGMSTFNQVSAESNVLNQMDHVTNRVNNEILKAQRVASLSAGVGGKIFVALSNRGRKDAVSRRAMDLSKPLYGNELRNIRRQFLKWIAGHPMPDGTGEEEMTEAYVAYIESHI